MKPKIVTVAINGKEIVGVVEVTFMDKYTLIMHNDGSFIKTNMPVIVGYEKMEG
jgi:hypothetical protein